MATVSVDVDVEIEIEDHLDEVSTDTLCETLSERPRVDVLLALQRHSLIGLADDSADMTDLENMISAFNTGDRDLFQISLRNLFPTAKEQIAFAMCQKQMSLAA